MRTDRLIQLILGLTLAAIPVCATISYSVCDNGCGASGGTYSAWQSQFGTSGQSLSGSTLLTFAGANLSGSTALYTDPTTGTAFYGYNNTTLDSLNVSGTQLTQTISGTGSSIQIALPANTYAIAIVMGAASFANPWVELVSSPSDLNTSTNAQYQAFITSSSSPTFFGIVSDAPLTSLFVWNSGFGGTLNIQSFEIATTSGGSVDPTPEPSSFLLMGGGLAGFLAFRRRVATRRGW
jgi:PEP-CTERM motif